MVVVLRRGCDHRDGDGGGGGGGQAGGKTQQQITLWIIDVEGLGAVFPTAGVLSSSEVT